jgi:hypothetical protein
VHVFRNRDEMSCHQKPQYTNPMSNPRNHMLSLTTDDNRFRAVSIFTGITDLHLTIFRSKLERCVVYWAACCKFSLIHSSRLETFTPRGTHSIRLLPRQALVKHLINIPHTVPCRNAVNTTSHDYMCAILALCLSFLQR